MDRRTFLNTSAAAIAVTAVAAVAGPANAALPPAPVIDDQLYDTISQNFRFRCREKMWLFDEDQTEAAIELNLAIAAIIPQYFKPGLCMSGPTSAIHNQTRLRYDFKSTFDISAVTARTSMLAFSLWMPDKERIADTFRRPELAEQLAKEFKELCESARDYDPEAVVYPYEPAIPMGLETASDSRLKLVFNTRYGIIPWRSHSVSIRSRTA